MPSLYSTSNFFKEMHLLRTSNVLHYFENLYLMILHVLDNFPKLRL